MKSIHNSGTASTDAPAPGAVERLFELAARLVDGMEHGLAERGLTRARAELLWRLHHQGAMTQRALSQVLQCTPRNVTGLVDALEGAGLVAREPHPSDRRATLVALTERGRSASATMQRDYRRFGARMLAGLEPEQLACFVGVVDLLLERVRASGLGASAAGPSRPD